MRAAVVGVLIVLTSAGAATAQTSLAGTWKLDQEGARGGGRGGGVPGFPLATVLQITVMPTEVVIESDTGSAQSIQTFVYKLDGAVTKVPGPLGWDTTAKAGMDGDALRVTIRREITGPNGPVGVNVTDVYRVDGSVLTLERTLNDITQTLVYRK
jgi:hypothetical protein